ncbi:GNAT family N-acetyltransferase [Fructobacillus evanidus]|uniref:Predicted N-acetyltransferase YhbS (YhbS) n=1 Tax=Fructobacillus evanidus TaxID=3064281 RepID=A0ABN9YRR3_9LACO|nr:Predicted N-acetyltransferase YhbS (yhbS) [Fructobacillus sp. LMG 32999]CAK1234931.1 Predicted N-acetyltransferase YhbS (yhbS) [Fructobacillus sp. LMG 32999]CAK1235661.1 Predicted N-acetyltransferase YhbS (yhbS) [Fructobacillus sp. LMG 32999]CAK1236085.1 Predicted N-acetyltransferase YhbS (yhbS) [Fructobacillus sp. LMG 32999]CAK1237635.1 Predicted N-acetyltransferase YhbS (yhbS) [Fructobacillus sp. LMG 32999]
MAITFGKPNENDLDKIMDIEHSGFSEAEAATRESMLARIKIIPDTFIVAYDEQGNPAGYIVGPASTERYISDELFETSVPNSAQAPYQTILSLVVSPEKQKMVIAGQLLQQLAVLSKQQGRQLITLTCLEKLVPFYERNGYQVDGISDSQHAGETWYNMTRKL